MRKAHSIITALLASLVQVLPLSAQTEQPKVKDVVNAKMLATGYTNILDTYISPEHYTGTELRFIDETIRKKEKWPTMLTHQAQISYTKPRSDEANNLYALYTFGYALHRRWQLVGDRLELKVGGQAEVGGGFLYNTRNGNNPAQARLYLNVGPSAAAAYDFQMGSHRSAVTYQMAAPLLGILFSPNYGQSYYEIFSKDDYDHNVVVTTPFCAPTLRQQISLDMQFGRSTLRIGYLCDIQQAKVNNLKYHTYSHLLVLGYVRHFEIHSKKW